MADAKAGKFKVVVFYKIDRISRNLRDFLDITDTLQKSGVRLACVAHPIDTGTAAGRRGRGFPIPRRGRRGRAAAVLRCTSSRYAHTMRPGLRGAPAGRGSAA